MGINDIIKNQAKKFKELNTGEDTPIYIKVTRRGISLGRVRYFGVGVDRSLCDIKVLACLVTLLYIYIYIYINNSI